MITPAEIHQTLQAIKAAKEAGTLEYAEKLKNDLLKELDLSDTVKDEANVSD